MPLTLAGLLQQVGDHREEIVTGELPIELSPVIIRDLNNGPLPAGVVAPILAAQTLEEVQTAVMPVAQVLLADHTRNWQGTKVDLDQKVAAATEAVTQNKAKIVGAEEANSEIDKKYTSQGGTETAYSVEKVAQMQVATSSDVKAKPIEAIVTSGKRGAFRIGARPGLVTGLGLLEYEAPTGAVSNQAYSTAEQQFFTAVSGQVTSEIADEFRIELQGVNMKSDTRTFLESAQTALADVRNGLSDALSREQKQAAERQILRNTIQYLIRSDQENLLNQVLGGVKKDDSQQIVLTNIQGKKIPFSRTTFIEQMDDVVTGEIGKTQLGADWEAVRQARQTMATEGRFTDSLTIQLASAVERQNTHNNVAPDTDGYTLADFANIALDKKEIIMPLLKEYGITNLSNLPKFTSVKGLAEYVIEHGNAVEGFNKKLSAVVNKIEEEGRQTAPTERGLRSNEKAQIELQLEIAKQLKPDQIDVAPLIARLLLAHNGKAPLPGRLGIARPAEFAQIGKDYNLGEKAIEQAILDSEQTLHQIDVTNLPSGEVEDMLKVLIDQYGSDAKILSGVYLATLSSTQSEVSLNDSSIQSASLTRYPTLEDLKKFNHYYIASLLESFRTSPGIIIAKKSNKLGIQQ
ncbi:MAG: hypothetical protein WCJ58_06380 [bacterium]